jgi:hypothetical protein
MVDEPKPVTPIVYGHDVGRAPIIFFDGAPSFGSVGGLAYISISAMLQVPSNVEVKVEHHVVAHLRTNMDGLRALRAAIDGALLAMQPVEGQTN